MRPAGQASAVRVGSSQRLPHGEPHDATANHSDPGDRTCPRRRADAAVAQETTRLCLDVQAPAYAIDLSDPAVVQQEIVLGNLTLLDVVDCVATDGTGAMPEIEEAPAADPAPERPSTYEKLSRRDWQRLIKSPERYADRGYQVWACIFQFDAATGEEGFLGMAGHTRLDYWYTDGDNASFTGDASRLEESSRRTSSR
jgi:hypothetical protein